MKMHVLKLITFVVIATTSFSSEAQLLKKLKDKVNRKVEQTVEREVDKTLEDLTTKKPKPKEEADVVVQEPSHLTTPHGSAILKHSSKYNNFNIQEFGKAVLEQNNEGVKIYGSWVTHAADIHDGYVLTIPKGNDLLFDDNAPKKKQIKLKIPEDAMLKLSYDPIWDPELKDEYGFSSAVTKHYQSYELESGEIIIDVLSEANIQLSFSGKMQLVTRTKNPKKNTEEEYILSYTPSIVNGAIDISPINFIDGRTVTKPQKTSKEANLPSFSNNTVTPGIYNFTFETAVRITNTDDNKTYNMFYLLNPNAKYVGLKVDMGAYSDEEVDGESIIVMDGDDAHVFVETQGMKVQMSQGMMANQKMQNPTDQMNNYDYTKLTKTGKTKTVLGAKCYEYVMSDTNTRITLWVAPSVNLPNWFIQNKEVLNGHIMEYTINSKEGNVKSETIAIRDNIQNVINPKEYKKMF